MSLPAILNPVDENVCEGVLNIETLDSMAATKINVDRCEKDLVNEEEDPLALIGWPRSRKPFA